VTKQSRSFILIIILFLLISLAYSMIVPVFNAPDEPFHFEYIRFLAKNKRLPNQKIEERSISTEGFNPPLYYLVNSVFLSLLSGDKASDIQLHNYRDIAGFFRNPYKRFRSDIYPPLNPYYIKWRQGSDRNMFLTTQADQFPFAGSIRVIHLLRVLSIFLAALTILFIFKIAQAILPDHPYLALLAVSVCAFNPQFNFLSGSLNNDNLVILLATIAIWLLTRLIFSEPDHEKGIILLLGVFIGLGFLTKFNLSGVLLVVLAGIIYHSWVAGENRFRRLCMNLSLFLGPLICITGWYFVRNVLIYGINDPLGWQLQAIQNPGLVMPAHIRGMFFRKVFFQRIFTSFWGQFDWLTISLPHWTYWIYGIISMTGILGLVIALGGKGHHKRFKICILLYLAIFILSLAGLIILNLTFLSAQARLIFPAISGICILIALGMDWIGRHLAGWTRIKGIILIYAFIGMLVLMDIYTLIRVIYPVYR
jgi:flagellar basal body-associated protein FliL